MKHLATAHEVLLRILGALIAAFGLIVWTQESVRPNLNELQKLTTTMSMNHAATMVLIGVVLYRGR